MGTIDTINSGRNVAVECTKPQKGLGPIETLKSGAKGAVLNAKTIGEVWDQCRLVILVLMSLFCIQKSQMRAGTYRDY